MSDKSELDHEIYKLVSNLSEKKKERLIEMILSLQSSADDQRETMRKDIHIPIDYSIENKFYTDTLKNLSASGAFILTPMDFEPGSTAAMIISLPGLDRNIKISGVIVRHNDEGFGIKFTTDLEKWSDIIQKCLESDNGS